MPFFQKCMREYRNEIKGFAILWVIFFHAELELSGLLFQVQKIGYGGVDLFFFLSGYGLFCSLKRNADLKTYFKRRAARILPAYIPFCLLWLAVMVPLYGGGKTESLRIIAGNLTMTGFLADVPLYINWYLSGLLLSLLAAPLIYAIICDERGRYLRAAALMAFLLLLDIAFVDCEVNMAISRLPVFVLGMLAAAPHPVATNEKRNALLLSAAGVIGLAVLYACFAVSKELLVVYAMYWHPFILITPALCLWLFWFLKRIPDKALAPLRLLGRASFEIFLFNVWVEVLGKKFHWITTPWEWVLWSLVGLAVGLGYHWIIAKVVKKVVDKRMA